jgi:predicted nuclease of predicted toxin-antitoxin system
VSRVFAELYLDEDVSALVAELLRARGFDVQTTQEAGRKGTRDEEQLAYAAGQRRALLTHNRDDFARLAGKFFAAGRRHHGIIIAVRRPPHAIARRLLTILNHATADELENQVIYI